MAVQLYEENPVELEQGVYFVKGHHSAVRSSLIANVVHEASACAVSYENFCKALGLPTGNKNCDAAFRGAVEALLEVEVPVIVTDVQTLDQADIALHGWDGPSEMRELREGLVEQDED